MEKANITFSKIIPFSGFYAMNLFGRIFVRSKYKDRPLRPKLINHELIHTHQMKDFCKWLPVGGTIFYILYVLNWLLNLIIHPLTPYRSIVFEKEAYDNDQRLNYLESRKRFAWTKYLFKRMDHI